MENWQYDPTDNTKDAKTEAFEDSDEATWNQLDGTRLAEGTPPGR